MSKQPICEGRYPVPQTSPPRDEPFDVTYRCALDKGHDGPHGAESTSVYPTAIHYDPVEKANAERDQWKHLSGEAAKGLALADKRVTLLREALVGLVGVDTRAELEQLEAVMRLMPAPAQDKAATIDAIHALLATLAE